MPEFTTGALDNQAARRNVPETDALLDVGVEPPRGDIRQVQRRGAHNAYLANTMRQVDEGGQGGFEVVAGLGETNRNYCLAQLAALAHLDDSPVQPGSLATNSGPQLAAEGVVNDTDEALVAVFVIGCAGRFRPALEGYRYARMGYAVCVIDRSINRIHYPAVLGIRQPRNAFFSEHGYAGEAAEE